MSDVAEISGVSPARATEDDDKITCQIDGARVHAIHLHLKKHHPTWTVDMYREKFPDAPLMSAYAKQRVDDIKRQREQEKAKEDPVRAELKTSIGTTKQPLNEVFSLGRAKAAMNARGEPIMIDVLTGHDEDSASFVPAIDPNYVFDIEIVKNMIIGFQLGMPIYLWGYHGTGKTTMVEQVAARTKRPTVRIQHTIGTEESHILGQYVVKDGATEYQLGPLPIAMLNGWVYLADEYDFAMPSVLSVYQPVLEGKALVIKDAPPEFRVIRPHRDFRFAATGNTNGGGDETGLYQGTQIQNAANYSRFAITMEIGYMEAKTEQAVIAGQAGITSDDAVQFVKFAKDIREAFKAGRIGTTISPRELINSAKIGMVRGSDWRSGLMLGYGNRLSRTDREVIDQFCQRIFG